MMVFNVLALDGLRLLSPLLLQSHVELFICIELLTLIPDSVFLKPQHRFNDVLQTQGARTAGGFGT